MGHRVLILILIIATALIPAIALAQQPARPTIPAVEVEQAPKLDGDLSDECWQKAPKVQDFYVMANGAKASEQTEAWICYDKKGIYAAFRCTDSQPDKIVARETKRGASGVSDDDLVALDIDCFNTHDQIVWVDVTANGVQMEHLQSGEVSKIEWRGDWDAAAKRIPEGFNAEIAIPWSILQYDPKQTGMGIMFGRKHQRTGGMWWGSPWVGSDWDPKRFYYWDGLRLPEYKKRPLFLGYSCLNAGQDRVPNETGMDIKHSFTPQLTGVLSVNPDFRDVEQQVQGVDFSYTEKLQSDGRPYFQEGERFFPNTDLFYTRRIDQINYGGKLMGTVGDYSMGVMHARGSAGQLYDIAKLSRVWAGKARIDLSAVNTNAPTSSNLSMALSGDYMLYDKKHRKVQFWSAAGLADAVAGGERGHKLDLGISAWGPPRGVQWGIQRLTVDSDFDPVLGYIPEKGIRMWHANVDWWDSPAEGPISYFGTGLNLNMVDHQSGDVFHNDFSIWAGCEWRKDLAANVSWATSKRPPYRDNTTSLAYKWLVRNARKSGRLDYTFGTISGGSYSSYSASQSWPLTNKLAINASYGFSRISQPSPIAYEARQVISGLTYDLSSERAVSGRLVKQSGHTNLSLSYWQRVRAGLDVYLLYGDPNSLTTKNAVTLKLVRPLF